MIIEIFAAVIVLFIVGYTFKSSPKPLCGVYAQPGPWFQIKKFLFNLLFLLRQHHQKVDKVTQDDVGYGKKSQCKPQDMECTQSITGEFGIDTVYFNGFDGKGTYFVLRIARRINRQAEIWLTVTIPEIGFLQHPNHPHTVVYNTDGKGFSAGGLKFECLEPMRRWRITYNGLMRKGLSNKWTEDSSFETVHVKFAFFWESVTEVFDFDSDIHAESLSVSVAREKWTRQFWQNLRKSHQTHYEQWGELKGVVEIDSKPEMNLILKSARDHSYGVRDWESFHRYIVHFGWMEDGTFFHVNVISIPISLSYLQCGYVSFPNGEMHPIHYSDLKLPELGEQMNPPKQYSFQFKAGIRTYSGTVNITEMPEYRHGKDWGNVIYEGLCEYKINGIQGYGVAEFCYRDINGQNPVPQEHSIEFLQPRNIVIADESEQQAYCLPFTSTACQLASIVGGKGCQLALLTSLQSSLFTVPRGFCLTIQAFDFQINRHEIVREHISRLAQLASGEQVGNLKQFCDKTVDVFLSTQLHENLKNCIERELSDVFGTASEYTEGLSFAVRSSATGEDSDELSAAGQMETILGVKGLDNIYTAVQKCWASHYAYPAVEYRRQHGQPICSNMGVVIQQMVPAEAAGVLFTREPISGNPGKMVINANYGLGESVVSGTSEPDNIYIHRTWDERLTIESKDIGNKKIQLHINAEGGTTETAVNTEQNNSCCIADNLILRLSHIGVLLEKHFSDPRDIEWAIQGDNIYLLQARPITTLDQESEWELMHEFDSPLAMKNELLTTANISEMMPGAMTPLTLSVFLRSIEWSLQDFMNKQGLMSKHMNFWKYVGVVCNHGFINMHFVNGSNEERAIGSSYKMAHLALLGEVIEDITMEQLRSYHGTFSPIRRIVNGIKNFWNLQASYAHTKNWEKLLQTFIIGENSRSAHELYERLDAELNKYWRVFSDTNYNSARSSTWSFVLMAILTEGKEAWKTEHYSDVALLLSKCEDVYSADVPSALQDLALTITQIETSADFVQMTPKDAVLWLESRATTEVTHKYNEFMKRHGHRCIREAEFRVKSWQSEPIKLVTVVQSLVKMLGKRNVSSRSSEAVSERVENIEEAISKVKTPLTKVGKFILKRILPRARRAVGGREWGKSVSIKMVEAFKQAYWRLAEVMVAEGRLPDGDLIFFFTHQEIALLLEKRSGAMITKAQRRRKLLSKQMALKFPRLNFGHPQAIQMDNVPKALITSSKIKGLPVSRGVVQGKARVVTSLEDASNIEMGDILIVQFTDVGWSPYFPLISGLVTEIGGLVSHGAVVAREYGLPCVVNCPNATQIFQSGDQVILNGNDGTIEKIEE